VRVLTREVSAHAPCRVKGRLGQHGTLRHAESTSSVPEPWRPEAREDSGGILRGSSGRRGDRSQPSGNPKFGEIQMAVNLQVAQTFNSTVQSVNDQNGNASSLALSTGKVGIGTTSPTTKLEVVGDWTGEEGALRLTGDKPTVRFSGGALSGNQSWIIHVGGNGPGNLEFYRRMGPSQWNFIMCLAPTGNVGIGTPIPAHKMHVLASSGNGVFGTTADHNAAGVRGENSGGGHGVEGFSVGTLTGIYGRNTGTGIGVIGESANATGVWALGAFGVVGIPTSSAGAGIYGSSVIFNTGLAGKFDGDVQVNGNLIQSAGSFRIDHPLDPENQYLYHSFIESPDMMNIYNGNVTTDANGEAIVALPDYFEALNRDFRYQLTVVGQFAQAMVASKIQHARFTIKTDKPSVEVSWQVTGIRQDAYANAHRIQVEEEKPASERGSLLHPEAYGRAPKRFEEGDLLPEMKELIKKHRERLQKSTQ
jgi:hypothetical protein